MSAITKKVSIFKENKELNKENKELYKENKELHKEYINRMYQLKEALEELNELKEYKIDNMSSQYTNIDTITDDIMNDHSKPIIQVKKYALNDHRYENIMSHMDILWCDSKGWDNCDKCTGYRDIIMSALDKIESMSSRRIDKDFATKHKSGNPGYNIKDNTNAVTILGGGDKDEDEYVDNCMAKREYRS